MVGIAQPDRRTTETGLSQVQILPARPKLLSQNNQNANIKASFFMVLRIRLWACTAALLFAFACDIRTR
jgi:hypothetical protein